MLEVACQKHEEAIDVDKILHADGRKVKQVKWRRYLANFRFTPKPQRKRWS